MVLFITYANTGAVDAQNTELELAVSQGEIEDKIIKSEDSSNVFLLSTLNAEASDSKGNDVKCQDVTDQDVTDCSNTKSEDNKEDNKEDNEIESSTDILLPFP